MKKIFAVIIMFAFLTGCTAESGESASISETTNTETVEVTQVVSSETPETVELTELISTEAPETVGLTEVISSESSETTTDENSTITTSEEATAVETSEEEYFDLPSKSFASVDKNSLVNKDGTLTEAYEKRLEDIMSLYKGGYAVYPGLYDFDYDGLPEIYLTFHNSGQGYMPCEVYRADDFSYLGEFNGYCRDGFTRFSKGMNGTVMHNYFEHSNWQRNEIFTLLKIQDGKLINTEIAVYSGDLNYGECYATMGIKKNYNEEIKRCSEINWNEKYGCGNSISSYNFGDGWESEEVPHKITELYNKYIMLKSKADSDDDVFVFLGEGAFYKNNNCLYFVNSSNKTIKLSNQKYSNIYRLFGSMVVCEQNGKSGTCDVYSIDDGKPYKIEDFSDKGVFNFSSLYNECYEIKKYENDSSDSGSLNYKTYTLFFHNGSLCEYGGTPVSISDFKTIFGDSANRYIEEISAEGGEITEILYRSDCIFNINYRIPSSVEEADANSKTDENVLNYNNKYITLKQLNVKNEDGMWFNELDRGNGTYLAALIPDIAVYPDKKPTVD